MIDAIKFEVEKWIENLISTSIYASRFILEVHSIFKWKRSEPHTFKNDFKSFIKIIDDPFMKANP